MRKNGSHVTASTDRTQLTFPCLTLDNVGYLEDTPNSKNTIHSTAIAMFCNKDTTDEENALELQRPAAKNYTKKGNHVQILS